MKSRLFALLLLAMAVTLNAQSGRKDHFMTIDGVNLGGYISVGGKYTTYNSKAAGLLDLRAAVTFKNGWGVGIGASGLDYDKSLSALVNDGTYHVEAGYVGMFVEKMFSVTDDFKISLSVLMAGGLMKYRYDSEYRKEKVWYEETIDQTDFFVTEPALEIQHRIFGNWWLGVTGSFRNTSPIKLIGTDEDVLKKFAGGVTIKYGVF